MIPAPTTECLQLRQYETLVAYGGTYWCLQEAAAASALPELHGTCHVTLAYRKVCYEIQVELLLQRPRALGGVLVLVELISRSIAVCYAATSFRFSGCKARKFFSR
jgi:hypothetical protein